MSTQLNSPRDSEQAPVLASAADRVRWEAAKIAKAQAEIAAGLGIDDKTLEAWLDALDRDPQIPMPMSLKST